MFDLLLINLRSQGVAVGVGEWLAFLRGLQKDLAVDLDGLYEFGRSILVQSEAQYDAWDLAFSATFAGVELPPDISKAMASWLDDAQQSIGPRLPTDLDPEELRRQFHARLKEQGERHDGGNHWVGTGGTSPFGSGGRSSGGVRVGPGGGRSAILVAEERQWVQHRVDTCLDHRDLKVALRAMRALVREGEIELDLDDTIKKTADNAGEIELSWRRERANRVHLVLLMDTGGSMDVHARLVSQLFTAAAESGGRRAGGFKSFTPLFFHNVPYGWLHTDQRTHARIHLDEAVRSWTPEHRVVLVGDASMAPYELFTPFAGSPWGGRSTSGRCGLDWLKLIRQRCPHSMWLNPDPEAYWRHPTVEAIGRVFPMHPLTLEGLRDGIRGLRAHG